MSQDIQEKHDHVRNLTALGKERGYLLAEEVNDFLAAEEHTSEEIDNVLSAFESDGIEVYEDASAAKAARGLPEVAESTNRRCATTLLALKTTQSNRTSLLQKRIAILSGPICERWLWCHC